MGRLKYNVTIKIIDEIFEFLWEAYTDNIDDAFYLL